MNKYDHRLVESKWMGVWEQERLFVCVADSANAGEKLYLLFAFAYPSGSGLHVGHVESKTALDILARYNRMKGKNVFFPVGWDAFGLPAENYAIKTGVHPAKTTRQAIDTFRRQIKRIGISYDWESELATSHPGYYKWTQWLFLKLFDKGLAYKKPGTVNWCPSCQTVLANEQVVDGHCERCGTEVVQRELEQWYFKITDYKDELIRSLEQVDWPRATEEQQRNWIGRSEGALVKFEIRNSQDQTNTNGKFLKSKHFEKTFTTRVDTVFGVTFLAVSPERAREWEQQGWNVPKDVARYIDRAFKKTEEERKIGEKDKTGVNTGLVAVNPVNGKRIPVYVADYVLAGYGTGVVMGVPAHDERDHAFAKKFGLPIAQVIDFGDGHDYQQSSRTGFDGKVVNSGEFDGLGFDDMAQGVSGKFDEIEGAVTYKLRDWLISRQRYWGAPIPVVYDPEGKAHPVKEEHLPWLLPTDVEFKPTGESPLADSKEFKERVEKLYGKGWRPEYDTMDTFVDSSWYFLRYPSVGGQKAKYERNPSAVEPHAEARSAQDDDTDLKSVTVSSSADNEILGWDRDWSLDSELPFDRKQLDKWLPVDFYMIGPEHIVLHLLYARFFTKFLRDEGYLCEVKSQRSKVKIKGSATHFDPDDHQSHRKAGLWCVSEPFAKMRHQGMILGPDHKKMSKSRGNVIDPDVVIEKYGADALRMYEMFLGPIEAEKPWSTESVVGIGRFLDRVYRLVNGHILRLSGAAHSSRGAQDDEAALESLATSSNEQDVSGVTRKLEQTIKKVGEDIEALKFNTAIAAMMEMVNEWEAKLSEALRLSGTTQSSRSAQGDKTDFTSLSVLSIEEVGKFVRVLAPFAPFLAEELWQRLQDTNNKIQTNPKSKKENFRSVHEQKWPDWDPELVREETVTVVIQVNGKVRAQVEVEAEKANDKGLVLGLARDNAAVVKWLEGKQVRKEVFVPFRLVNFVV